MEEVREILSSSRCTPVGLEEANCNVVERVMCKKRTVASES